MRLLTLCSLLVVLALSAVSAAAQDRGSVSGKVSDKRSGHALAFASVTVVEAKRGVLTDSEGQFLISGVAPGSYEVRVQFSRLQVESRAAVVVVGGKKASVNFTLEEQVVTTTKQVEVTAERRLVEARQGPRSAP